MAFRREKERGESPTNDTDSNLIQKLRGGARRKVNIIDLSQTGEGLRGRIPTNGTDHLLEPGTFGEVVAGWTPDLSYSGEHYLERSRSFRPAKRPKKSSG